MKVSILILVLFSLSFSSFSQPDTKTLTGAWETNSGGNTISLILTDRYFSMTEYNLATKVFVSTRGGSWSIQDDKFMLLDEFNTAKPENVGKRQIEPYSSKTNELMLKYSDNGQQLKWTKIDNGTPGQLSGAWLITGRMQNGEMQALTPGARRTMKILSGTRFQWIAYNTETKEFFGTGGGTYETKNGEYIENIQFFSRDNSRVGQSLKFRFAFESDNWRHTGFSSKGDPIDEVWSTREKLGL
jgi:hypothetical protein